jgi:hypothetical protein
MLGFSTSHAPFSTAFLGGQPMAAAAREQRLYTHLAGRPVLLKTPGHRQRLFLRHRGPLARGASNQATRADVVVTRRRHLSHTPPYRSRWHVRPGCHAWQPRMPPGLQHG